MKPLFVCASFLMGILTLVATIGERMVRNRYRLVKTKRLWERNSNWVTIITSFLGYLSLFLVATLDSRDYYSMHIIALAMFLGLLGVSSFTIVSEFFFLDPDHVNFRRFQVSYFFRLLWSILEVGLIIAFTTYSLTHNLKNGCLLEWVSC